MISKNETAEKWLYRAYKLDKEIELLLETRQQIYNQTTNITAKLSAVPGGGSPDPHKFERLAEFDEKIMEEYSKLITIRIEIENAISRLGSTEQRQCLTLRLLRGMSFEDIAKYMHYSRQQVWRIYKHALSDIVSIVENMLHNVT